MFAFRNSGKCDDVHRLLPPPSPFLCYPSFDRKEEPRNLEAPPEVLLPDADKPLPTSDFPLDFYVKESWMEKLKYDWKEGGPECPYLLPPSYAEKDGIRGSIGGVVRKVLQRRPKKLFNGDFIAFASADKDYPFYVGRILVIRCHSIFIQFYGDKFLGNARLLLSF